MNFQASGGQSPQQQPSLAAPGGGGGAGGGGQFGGAGPGAGGGGGPSQQLAGGPPQQFALSNSAAIRAEIQRFESVHPNIYAIYDLIERIEDLALQNQIREHVISIEESFQYVGIISICGWAGLGLGLSNFSQAMRIVVEPGM
ncbi:Arf-Gap With Gtpase, Ank Repeat And Ph Domain-Containing Protein 3 [Manis pentadactyla]|nr:Arf-Gap With Gtpase, Ank Repeat And Ph Domain-Containing Protein 3 [Manis pentadactyla]